MREYNSIVVVIYCCANSKDSALPRYEPPEWGDNMVENPYTKDRSHGSGETISNSCSIFHTITTAIIHDFTAKLPTVYHTAATAVALQKMRYFKLMPKKQ